MMSPRPGGRATPPLVSVSIISHGDGQPLMALLESISSHESVDQVQLIITDNLGNDLPDLALGGWHSVTVLRAARPRGFAANHNAAFEKAAGTYFCILNPDVLFTQPVFGELIAHLDPEHAQLAAPLLVNSRGDLQDSYRPLPTPWEIVRRRLGMAARVAAPDSGTLLQPDWVAGIFMLMRASTFSELGGFDDGYRLYFEDVELCTRLRLAGGRIVVDPSLRLLHDPRHGSRRPGRHLLWHAQSAARFFASSAYRRARRLPRYA